MLKLCSHVAKEDERGESEEEKKMAKVMSCVWGFWSSFFGFSFFGGGPLSQPLLLFLSLCSDLIICLCMRESDLGLVEGLQKRPNQIESASEGT